LRNGTFFEALFSACFNKTSIILEKIYDTPFLRKLITGLVILSVSFCELTAQKESYITGKILVAGTVIPVPFATIRMKQNQIGVFANADGDFRILNNPIFAEDSIIVSCIGFRQTAISFRTMSDTSENRLFLQPATYGLKEIRITASRKKLKSVDIVSNAIKNIRKNYPQGPFNYTCYYRDYQKRDGKYQNLNEAIIHVKDGGFRTPSIAGECNMLDFKTNSDFPRVGISPFYSLGDSYDHTNPDKFIPSAKLGDQFGNEFFVLQVHDAIRNFRTRSFSFIDVLSENFLSNHFFGIPEPVYDNNILLYKIFFNAKTRLTGDSLQATGAIYIQPVDYSIHKLEYSCYYLLKGFKRKEMFNIDIEYDYEKSIGSPLFLKYISFRNLFRVADPSDSSYFRVVESYVLPEKANEAKMVLVFNRRVNNNSARDRLNYDIMLGGKSVGIKDINVQGKRILITVRKKNITEKISDARIVLNNIRDVSGNVVNERNPVELNQYRELFVLDHNKRVLFRDSCLLQYTPLENNCISHPGETEKYWMNTPEKIRQN